MNNTLSEIAEIIFWAGIFLVIVPVGGTLLVILAFRFPWQTSIVGGSIFAAMFCWALYYKLKHEH
jgi:hypothetical protein